MTANQTSATIESSPEWPVDDLARRAGLPVRTIREYQTIGLLPPPRKLGRVGLYGPSHLIGLAPDQLVHIDEPGVPATLSQLTAVLPGLVPERLHELIGAGVIERCSPNTLCIPSPSLVQLAGDALSAGIAPAAVLELLQAIGSAASDIADSVVATLATMPANADPARVTALVARGRGLLGHGAGRLTIHTLGSRLGVTGDEPANAVLTRLVESNQ
jgi:hypothetical protein